jgi:phospho-N-acetylmuramoyl-pentapeptide-transferase
MHLSGWSQIVGAFMTAFILCSALTPLLLGRLRRRGFAQHIRDDGPETHLKKEGTPSAGGLAIIFAICAALVAFGAFSSTTLLLLSLVLGCGAVGFLDDCSKVLGGRSLGLKARHKMLVLLILAAIFSWLAIGLLKQGKDVLLPGGGILHLSTYMALSLSIITLIFFTNAANLTDGLDGLAAGSAAIVGIALSIAMLARGRGAEALVSVAIAGACLAFLLFNAHPAAIFMGDTGALALGGGLAGVAILAGGEFLLCVAGLAFVLEALSVVGQVTSFQLTGKRIFRMTPLHHHFELKGITEKRIVRGFWLASAVFSVLGVALF